MGTFPDNMSEMDSTDFLNICRAVTQKNLTYTLSPASHQISKLAHLVLCISMCSSCSLHTSNMAIRRKHNLNVF